MKCGEGQPHQPPEGRANHVDMDQAEVVEEPQHVVGVAGGVDIAPDAGELAVSIDEEGRALLAAFQFPFRG